MEYNKRILIVDDNKFIHEDFRKILCPDVSAIDAELGDLERDLFDAEDAEQVATGANIDVAYQVDSAYQGQEALAMVEKAEQHGTPYALIFMDVRMPPGWDGVETISRIWKDYPYIEMVICTAYSDYTWEEILAKLGTSDKLLFLTKPFDAIAVQQMALTLVKKWNLGEQARNYVINLEKEVKTRTVQLEKLLHEIDNKNKELVSANKQLEKVALHDTLTGLPNRALFNDRLIHNIQIAQRENSTFALLILDIDNFKFINDTYGHQAGDIVLQAVANRLMEVLRTSDTVARLGGDEFALILESVDREVATQMADKTLQSLEPPIMIDSAKTTVIASVSIGIALFPDHGVSQEALIKIADEAMYQAKQSAIGYVIYNLPLDSSLRNRMQLYNDLKDALTSDNSQLTLNYQPIIDLKSQRVCGVEALSRWQHPEKGNISPTDFIPLAEQKGLIQLLTLRVLNLAMRQCLHWQNQGLYIAMSINLSTRNFLDPVISREINKLLAETGIDPKWIKLEITESMTITNPNKALEIIRGLKEIGLQISIDDFGTGYSSLAYLKRLTVHELKIDRMFVSDMATEDDAQAIVKSTVDLAHTLGLKVVAEGVEDQRNLDALCALGCDMAQGFYICKPQSGMDITRWLMESHWKLEPQQR